MLAFQRTASRRRPSDRYASAQALGLDLCRLNRNCLVLMHGSHTRAPTLTGQLVLDVNLLINFGEAWGSVQEKCASVLIAEDKQNQVGVLVGHGRRTRIAWLPPTAQVGTAHARRPPAH